MRAPQIIMIVMLAMAVTISLCKHGEDKGKYNIWSCLISTAIEVALLKWGGFF